MTVTATVSVTGVGEGVGGNKVGVGDLITVGCCDAELSPRDAGNSVTFVSAIRIGDMFISDFCEKGSSIVGIGVNTVVGESIGCGVALRLNEVSFFEMLDARANVLSERNERSTIPIVSGFVFREDMMRVMNITFMTWVIKNFSVEKFGELTFGPKACFKVTCSETRL